MVAGSCMYIYQCHSCAVLRILFCFLSENVAAGTNWWVSYFFKVEQRQYANRCRNCNPNIIPCSRPSLFTEQYLLWADSVNFWNSPAYSLPIALKFGMRSHKITARGAANEETFVKWQHFRFRELQTFQNLIVIYSPLGEEAHEPHKSWLRWCHGIPHPCGPFY